jgi:hypothetical protein
MFTRLVHVFPPKNSLCETGQNKNIFILVRAGCVRCPWQKRRWPLFKYFSTCCFLGAAIIRRRFEILHGLLTNRNKIWTPSPWPPVGNFYLFWICFENIRNFILTKKDILTPQKIQRLPSLPPGGGGVFSFFLKFLFENFKSCPWVPKLRI